MTTRSGPPGVFEYPPHQGDLADTGSFLPGDFEKQYEQLFAEALEEGEISAEERQRLDLAAHALGLDSDRVARLETAIFAAIEGHAAITLAERADPTTLADRAEAQPVRFDSQFEDRQTPTIAVPSKAIDVNEALHERFVVRGKTGDVDAQLCVAEVLVQRKAATPEQHRCFEKYRTTGPVKPRKALTSEAWGRLIHPDQDRTTGEIFGIIASAALLGRVSAMRRDRTLPALEPEKKHDPMSSTVSAVRAVAWASATLGMRTPPVYVEPNENTAFEFVTAIPPALRIGGPMLAGLATAELAFHAGRHLTWFREEHFVCTLVPSIAHLEEVFLAALSIGAPEIELLPEVRARISLVAEAIRPVLDEVKVEKLRQAVARFVANGGRTSLRSWAQAAEWTAIRAGLLLVGDLALVSSIVAKEPNGAQRVHELESFWASEDATLLRRALGVNVGAS